MLGKAVGIDVLTTFADVEVADMDDKRASTTTDDLQRVERSIYHEAGVSQMQFNTDGNLALEKSILNDEASLYNLILQFEEFLNLLVNKFNKQPKKYYYRVQLLTTTIYNYKEMSKLYKEQTQLGYSKMLPQIALGHSQSFILNTAVFENDVLHLTEIMIPPLMSSTMSSQDVLGNKGSNNQNKTQNNSGSSNQQNTTKQITETKQSGRPEKADDQKSEKTIKNKESMS